MVQLLALNDNWFDRVAHNEVFFLEKLTSLGGLIFHLGYNELFLVFFALIVSQMEYQSTQGAFPKKKLILSDPIGSMSRCPNFL